MADSARERSILFQCDYNDFDYSVYQANSFMTTGCGSQGGIMYFFSFFLIVSLVFLNIFIAIILEGYETTSKRLNSLVSDIEMEKFVDCWARFDKHVRYSFVV